MGIQTHDAVTVVVFLIIFSCLVQAKDISVGPRLKKWFETIEDNPDERYNFQEWANKHKFHVHDVLDFGHPVRTELAVWVFNHSINCSDPPTEQSIIKTTRQDGTLIYTLTGVGDLFFYSSSNCEIWNFHLRVVAYHKSSNSKVKVVLGLSLAAFAVVVALSTLFVAVKARRKKIEQESKDFNSFDNERSTRAILKYFNSSSDTISKISDDVVLDVEWPISGMKPGPKRFSLKELQVATQSFSANHVLGEGGFGTVYKGCLRASPGLSEVAVKRLSQYARQGAREFEAEMNIISQLRHRNLVHLLGWCDEGDELILVYEFMPNGDLDDLIFGGYSESSAEAITLPWKHRQNILCGVAKALVYLHEEWEQRVVHRDVKTSNVMLDSQFNARLGDFGLARLCSHSQAPRTTLVAGTIGYLAPEFSLTGRATDKTDVYAFGVVVLEVLCARRPLTTNCILVDWAWELHKEDKLLDAIDPKLDSRTPEDEKEMKLFLQVGLLCSHLDASARPVMRTVLNILTGQTELPNMPRSKPVAYYAELGS